MTETFSIARLERVAKNRRPTYMAELRACGAVSADGLSLVFDTESECWRALQRIPAPPAAARREPVQPVPREKWPLSVRAIAKRARPGEAGVGDTVKQLLGEGGERFKRVAKRLRTDCGCSARQARLNAKYPY